MDTLFSYLWQRDELGCGASNVSIPDTIVFRHRQPAFWFFTSKDGSLKRRNRANVTNAKIAVRPPPHSALLRALVWGWTDFRHAHE